MSSIINTLNAIANDSQKARKVKEIHEVLDALIFALQDHYQEQQDKIKELETQIEELRSDRIDLLDQVSDLWRYVRMVGAPIRMTLEEKRSFLVKIGMTLKDGVTCKISDETLHHVYMEWCAPNPDGVRKKVRFQVAAHFWKNNNQKSKNINSALFKACIESRHYIKPVKEERGRKGLVMVGYTIDVEPMKQREKQAEEVEEEAAY